LQWALHPVFEQNQAMSAPKAINAHRFGFEEGLRKMLNTPAVAFRQIRKKVREEAPL